MPTVVMLQTTNYKTPESPNVDRFWVGRDYEVDKETADRWERLGIAVPGSERRGKNAQPLPEENLRRQVVENNLEVAAAHGDVAAARRLDALRRGELSPEEAGVTEGPETTSRNVGRRGQPAAQSPEQQTTGESARGTLSR